MHSRFDFIINEYIQFWRKFEGLKSLNEVSRLREKYQNLIKMYSLINMQIQRNPAAVGAGFAVEPIQLER